LNQFRDKFIFRFLNLSKRNKMYKVGSEGGGHGGALDFNREENKQDSLTAIGGEYPKLAQRISTMNEGSNC
jgi:hypothetical protein